MIRLGLGLLLGIALFAAFPAQAGRLEQIEARGYLTCGVYPHVAGFAAIDKNGRYSGFDIDICRAVAAAIFGTRDKVKYIEAAGVDVFRKSAGPDLVIRRLTWTLTREASLGLMFGPIVYYDGQGFMVPKSSGITAARQLAGKNICVEPAEGWGGSLIRYSQANGLDLKPAVAARPDSEASFFGRRCAAYSADKTMLASIRAGADNPQDYAILPDEISKEPLAPLVRQGDDRFFQIVRWSIFASIEAEELGVTSRNIDEQMNSSAPDVRYLLGVAPGNGKALGLSEHWAADIIRAVGNYGEIFARNLGPDSDIRLDRGLNRLWTDGGLIYAPPVR